jgi:hypothetical protein
MVGVQRTQAAEAGVDHPQFVVPIIGHFMNVDIARDMNAAGQIAGVMFPRRVQFGGHRRHVAVVPHGIRAADGQAGTVGGNAHGLGKGAEVGVEGAAVGAHHDDFARLVGRDHETDVQAVEEGRQVRRMDAAQRGVWSGRRRGKRCTALCSHKLPPLW